MNSHELQRKIQAGDRDAFRELYAACGQGVYFSAQEVLRDADAARDAVKQIFLNLHHEIQCSDRPLDIDARLAALTAAELNTRRILSGDFFAQDEAKPALEGEPQAEKTQAVPEPAPAVADPFEAALPYQPPLERAEAYMQADEAGSSLAARKKKREKQKPADPRRSSPVITVLIILFFILFVWVLVGILMDFSVLPRIDLGFSWFNRAIFPLFKLAS